MLVSLIAYIIFNQVFTEQDKQLSEISQDSEWKEQVLEEGEVGEVEHLGLEIASMCISTYFRA